MESMATKAQVIQKQMEESKIAHKREGFHSETLLLVISDILAFAISVVITTLIAELFGRPFYSIGFFVRLVFFLFLPVALVAAKLTKSYDFRVSISSTQELPKIAMSLGFAGMFTTSVGLFLIFIVKVPVLRYLAILWPIAVLFTYLFRVATRIVIGIRRAKGHGLRNVLIVGAGKVGNDLAKKLKNNPYLGFKPIGFVDSNPFSLKDEKHELAILGSKKDLGDLIKKYHIDHVIVSFSESNYQASLDAIRKNQNNGVSFSVVPRLFESMSEFDSMDTIQSIPIVTLQNTKQKGWRLPVKRLIDIVGSGTILLLSSPFMALIALLIKLDSKGPVFYKQDRCGKDGKHFIMFKFRSMVENAQFKKKELLSSNEARGPIFKIKEDPRITRIGAFLRKYSLDEFPQFINVFRGEMSLVGPRPPIPSEVEKYNNWHMQRLSVKPGITGIWQVNGRSDLTFEEMVRLDVQYINGWSLWLDIVLLIRTMPAVIAKRGAY